MFSPPRSRSPSEAPVRRTLAALLLAAGLLHAEEPAREPQNEPAQEPARAPVTYAVVVSPDVPISDVTLVELRRLFLFRKRFWEAGRRVTILLSETALEEPSYLLEEVYRVDDLRSLRRLILEKLYQEEIDLAPKIVASDGVALSFVASGKGLVTLVRADAVGDAKVKTLSIDGLLPDAEGYPARR